MAISTLEVLQGNIPLRLDAGDFLSATPTQAANLILSGAALTPAVIAAGDLVLIQDADDSLNLKTVTTQSIADLIGAGDVQGPAVATDDAVARFDGTTGKLIKDSVNTTINGNSHLKLLGVNASIDMVERAVGPSFQAGRGHFWVRDDVPSAAIFTDDVGTEFQLGLFTTAQETKLNAIAPLADVTAFTNVNAALVTPDADVLINSALGDFNFIVGGDTNANLIMADAGLDAVGIGAAAVAGSILTINTLTSPLELITSVFNAGLITPPTTTTGYITVEIGGNVCHIPCYTAIPT